MKKSREIAEHLFGVMSEKEDKKHEDTFNHWISNNPNAIDLLNELSDPESLKNKYERFGSKNSDKSYEKFERLVKKRKQRKLIKTALSISASLLAFYLVLNYYTTTNADKQISVIEQNISTKDDITISFSDNELYKIRPEETTIETNHGTIKTEGQNLSSFISSRQNESKVINATLSTPNKLNYAIKLDDGTIVTLNSNSKIMFPNKFTGDTREVTIYGEAFFDVAKDTIRPFIVNTHDVSIRVYGTKFNVNSYDKNNIETFLLTGEVGVSRDSNSEYILSPNHVISMKSNGENIVNEVTNNQKYIGWTSDLFVFEETSINDVINILSRWYSVDIETDNTENDNISISGIFQRDLDISIIIKTIERISNIKLKVKNYE